MKKQIALAALTALFIAGGAGVASAESGVSSAAADEGSSAALQADYAATHAAAMHPRASLNAYGYAGHRRHVMVTRHNR